jgi:hypothetical protein
MNRIGKILTLFCREHAERHAQAACNNVIDRKEKRNKHDAESVYRRLQCEIHLLESE